MLDIHFDNDDITESRNELIDEENETIFGNRIDWDLIDIREYPPNKLTQSINKPINALDTETLNGYCKLLADSSDKDNYIYDYELYDYLYFMTKKKFEIAHNFFYNLNYDINAIIKYLPRQNITEIKDYNETQYEEFKLFYIPRKIFSIQRGKHSYNFYDVAQFFKGSLNKNAEKYLQLKKYQNSYKNIDGKILGSSRQYWEDNLEMIIDYCLNDCKLTKRIGELLNQTVIKTLDLYPKKYMSKATLTKDYLKKTVDLPNIQSLPTQPLVYAFNSYTGGRFEIIEKGNVGVCSLYDINSAYPYHFKNLIDINKGKWVKVSDMHDKAYYGYYLVKVDVHYNKISPISHYSKNGTLTYPILSCMKFMTKKEILNYEKYADIEIINGWEYYPDEIVFPFKDFIDKVYREKKRISCLFNFTDDCKEDCNMCYNHINYKKITGFEYGFEYDLFKILMNGGYGLFMEKIKQIDGRYKAGELFNPIYATEITSGTQIDIFNYAMQDINNVLGFATDSVLFRGKPDLPTGNLLGEWDLEKSDVGLILKSGIYKIGKKIQSRGMKKAENLKTPYGEFKDIFDYLTSMPNLTSYPVILHNPLTFSKVIQQHKKYSIDDINIFTDEIYNIEINKDLKRSWEDEFMGGYDLLERSIKSQPLILA